MKKQISLLLFSITAVTAHAQHKTQEEAKITPTKREAFYQFLVPSSVNGSEIAPSAISNFNIGFGDDKASLKYGRAFKRTSQATKDAENESELKNSFSLSAGLSAPDGVGVVYKSGKSVEYNFKGGLTLLLCENIWTYTGTDDVSTQRFVWLNVIPQYSQAVFNVFANDTTYSEKKTNRYSIFGNINIYYHSKIEKRLLNGLLSIGAGVGKMNNYKTLNELTLTSGSMYNNGNTTYFVKKDETSGRLGSFEEFNAFLYAIDLYKSILREEKITWYVGGRLSGFAYSAANVTNGNAGFYLSFTGQDDNKRVEKFGFALTGNIDNIQGISDNADFRKKIYIALTANVPLNFSLEK